MLTKLKKIRLILLKVMGFDIENFINKDDLIHGVIDEDGYGSVLNHYDGSVDEIKILKNTYYVMKID